MHAKKMVGLVVVALLLAAGSLQADVFNMGGVRDPLTGAWTGLASLETVTVGDPGNAADTPGHSGHIPSRGSVAYAYSIGKYDVTAAQYCAFLNAVAATDTYYLYSGNGSYGSMSGTNSGNPGITQNGSSGNYTYSVAPSRANRPVTDVSFWDACRFANWLNNGQPSGAQGPGTTETGAYTLNGFIGRGGTTIQRNPGAKWALTSENEWYKAAYYDPTLNGGSGGYWDCATQSNTISSAQANYDSLDTTDVGSYIYPSYYGTFDQGGNVSQWNETEYKSTVDRGLRGGSFRQLIGDPDSSVWFGYEPQGEYDWLGFRVVEVPEPASMALLALGGMAMIRSRRK